MLENPRSHGLWERTAPPAPATGRLEGFSKADVVIVGGGFTGTSAALHLAQRGVSTVLLEAKEIGFGGSGRNVGLLNAGMWVMPQALVKALGPVYGPRLIDLLGNAPKAVFDLVARHGITCEITTTGTLHCGVGPKGREELEERARQWQALGADVRLLDAKETEAQTGTSIYPCSLLDLRAGTIQPLAYVRGIARAAIDAGARVFTTSPVTSVTREGSAWHVGTEHGGVEAKWLIIATDAYTQHLWPEIMREQVRLPYFNIATKPLSDNVRRSILPGRQGAWDTKTVLGHFRLDEAGRLIVGSIGALTGSGLPVHRAWARRHIERLFPHLGAVAFETEWYGNIGMTDDHLPRLHVFGENAIGFSGYNGRGIAPGTVFGRELALHVLGERSLADMPLPATPTRPASFRVVKELYYEFGSQIAHLPPNPV